MKTLYRLYEFLFDRWKWEIIEENHESWTGYNWYGESYEFGKHSIKYKLTNKFDGSVKIKKVYL